MATVKQKVELLQMTRELLVNHTRRSICSALVEAADGRKDLDAAYEYLSDYVSDALGDCAYLEGWQRLKHIKAFPISSPESQAARIAWVDWMIACYVEDSK
jgi:hypothetical protein